MKLFKYWINKRLADIVFLPALSEKDKELLKEIQLQNQHNLLPDEMMLNWSRKDLKESVLDFYLGPETQWDMLQWAIYKQCVYYDWVLEKLNCEYDKAYSTDQLISMSKLDANTFTTKIKQLEKW